MVQNIRTIGLPALLSFHTVARLGGVTAAAAHLGMVKSGVSRHVAQLEDHFGVRLFERGARTLKLTPIGETLNQRIRSILAEVDLLEDIAREESSGVVGAVTVVTTPEFAGFVMSALLPAALDRHPGLSFVVRPAYDFEDMQDPGVDLAFRIGSVVDDRLVAINLGDVQLYLVASPNIAEQYPVKHPEDMQNTPCLVFHGSQPDGSWTFVRDGEQMQVEITGKVAVRSFKVLLDLAIAGHGYAFLPHFMLKEALESGKLVTCLSGYRSRPYPVYLTFRPGARRVARIDAALSLAEETIQKMLRGSLQAIIGAQQGA
ncbi:LysR family transcriptional regulator [Roseibium sp.]|uniref:LysR family transcriptional regulator n=1 Tax=Roseibium sp. TaxID=1936156 RepID=UPI003D0DBB30